MQLTADIINNLTKALRTTNKKGEEIWKDGAEVRINVGGTFVADKFISIVIKNPEEEVDNTPGKKKYPPIKEFNGVSVTLLGGSLGKSYMKDWTEEQIKEYEEWLKTQ